MGLGFRTEFLKSRFLINMLKCIFKEIRLLFLEEFLNMFFGGLVCYKFVLGIF